MKDKHKKMILLTIQDLKDLGVIGKKKRGRRKKRRVLSKIQSQQIQQENPYFKSQSFQTSNNLDTENKRLENIKLGNEVSIRNNNIDDNKLINLQTEHNNLRDATIAGFQHFNHKTRFIDQDKENEPRFQSVSQNINFQDSNDNYDTTTSIGSDGFIAEGNDKPEYIAPHTLDNYTEPSIVSSTPTLADYGEDDNYTPYTQNKNINFSDLETDPIVNNPQIYLNDDENDSFIPKKSKHIIRLEQQHIAHNLGIPDEQVTDDVKHLKKIISDKIKLNSLISQYEGLGGNDDKFLNSNSIIEVRKEVKILDKESKQKLDKLIKPKLTKK